MSGIESHYSINIARARGAGTDAGPERGWDGEYVYAHYARLELSHVMEEEALIRLADTRTRYAAPAFKVDMTYWRCEGRRVGEEG